MKKILFLFYFLFFQTLFVDAQSAENEYDSDIEIHVDKNGLVTIDGKTDDPVFENVKDSPAYTSKDKEAWILNIKSPNYHKSFRYTVYFPTNVVITQIDKNKNQEVVWDFSSITVSGELYNQTPEIEIGYNQNGGPNLLKVGTGVFFIIILAIGIIVYFKAKEIRRKNTAVRRYDENGKVITYLDMDFFTERQQEIIRLLQRKGKLTQKEIEESLSIPKSSLSRNIHSLVLKGVIGIEEFGMTNYVFLKEKIRQETVDDKSNPASYQT